ncbi:MAG: hypothetical protein OQJ89_16590 [Kangiellaceae bacterium]|nr:hypothetical protein [Kangiellaceae bacterium]MCW9000114.1 hypothetical protein [Kangiellaceae bacterium]MCW9018593.1 hypothetical protein [Kangiellaceae bacterium]
MMKTNDKSMIEKYGITCEQKSIYKYKAYRYDKLLDAINFAKLDHERGDDPPDILGGDSNAQLKQNEADD